MNTATGRSRFFTNIAQRAPTWLRYGVAGMAVGQFNQPFVAGNQATVHTAADTKKASAANAHALTNLYVDVHRKDLERKA